jgi:hypothetical protein
LHLVRRLADAALEVAGVEQGDAHTGVGCRGDERCAHRVRVAVRLTVGLVVQVVELADARDAGEGHLGERRPGEPVVRLGIEGGRKPVHLVAPGPERSDAVVGAAAQGSVEGVAVGVGQARQGEPGEPDRVGRQLVDPTAGGDGDDAVAVDLHEHVGHSVVAAQPGELAVVGGAAHVSSRPAVRTR